MIPKWKENKRKRKKIAISLLFKNYPKTRSQIGKALFLATVTLLCKNKTSKHKNGLQWQKKQTVKQTSSLSARITMKKIERN